MHFSCSPFKLHVQPLHLSLFNQLAVYAYSVNCENEMYPFSPIICCPVFPACILHGCWSQWQLACWDFGFESRRGHGCVLLMSLILYRPCIVINCIKSPTRCTLSYAFILNSICFERIHSSSSRVYVSLYMQLFVHIMVTVTGCSASSAGKADDVVP